METKTREDIIQEIFKTKERNILLQLPTSFGKTKITIDLLAERSNQRWKVTKKFPKILVVVPRLVHFDTWKNEFLKWNKERLLSCVTFTTYASLEKHAGVWDFVVFDECQHLSERCRNLLSKFDIANSFLLSATVKQQHLEDLKATFRGLYVYGVSTREAIVNGILPDPVVLLYPLRLNGVNCNQVYIKRPAKKPVVNCIYRDRFKYLYNTDIQVKIRCTAVEYHQLLVEDINHYEDRMKYSVKEGLRFKWLNLRSQRLTWLSNQKLDKVKQILAVCKHERTLTFCNSIAQTEKLGDYPINSENGNSMENLEKFNNGEIDHITACNMLNEGVNLTDCRIGIYANLNSSKTIVQQRLGRILRHKNPLIIIPYYTNTREEELVKKMIEDYNPSLVHTINHLNELLKFLQ